ncbi:sugar phosphate nucleotidyltransferase [Thermogladius sp. 4427co]|uniref:sugar phosphate nucleotidyltransferase n=1 Tax=Thermogladius sp. 4427co TaxID=3450718 RepID=UPI003F79C249
MGVSLVILAGGLGTRLRPLTEVLPKPMVPIAGKPLLHHLIDWFKGMGFDRIYVSANYKAYVIKDYVERNMLNVEVRILDSKDTIDGVRLIMNELGDEVIVSMGDIVSDMDIRDMLKQHLETGADATIFLTEADNPLQYGIVLVDDSRRILLFTEKPVSLEIYMLSLAFYKIKGVSSFSNLINAGIYALGDRALRLISSNASLLDFGRHLFPMMVEEGYKCYGYIPSYRHYWEDIGTPAKYMKAVWDVISGYVKTFRADGKMVSSGVYIHSDSEVNGTLYPPVYIGRGAVVEEGAIVGPYVSLEGNVIVKKGSRIENSIVWWDTIIDENSYVRESILLNKVRVKSVKIVNSIVGSGNTLAEDVYSANVPNKQVG